MIGSIDPRPDAVGALWGGRFDGPPDELLASFGRSVDVDARLLHYDVAASRAWARELHQCGIPDSASHLRIDAGLAEIDAAATPADVAASMVEDVHTWIELQLVERIGEDGKRLHTGRSRNDQVMTSMRMWMRDACDALGGAVRELALSLVELAARADGCVLPAYTHMQRAQPMLFAHWCLAWETGLQRDAERVMQVRARVDVLPLGSGACVGTPVAIDRRSLADELGFARVSDNSIDAVSDRDCCIDVAGACAQIMVRLSRLADDLLLYTGPEYGFVVVNDAVTTGSSLLPHKRNLDPMELVRGRTGRVCGQLQALLMTSKGVPTAYARDLQEDKPALFDAVDTTSACLAMTSRVIANAEVRGDTCRAAAEHGYLEAMELADHLVAAGVPFRTAHTQAGAVVRAAAARGVELRHLSIRDIREHAPQAGPGVLDELAADQAIRRRDVVGGTSPGRVRAALACARTRWSAGPADGAESLPAHRHGLRTLSSP